MDISLYIVVSSLVAIRYPNTMITYREPDLVERLIDNGIL